MWKRNRYHSPPPQLLARRRLSRRRMDMVLARTCLAMGAQEKAAMMQMTFRRLWPQKAPMTIITGSWGAERNTLIKNSTVRSAQPPRYPAPTPRTPPARKAIPAADRPVKRLLKKPREIWA